MSVRICANCLSWVALAMILGCEAGAPTTPDVNAGPGNAQPLPQDQEAKWPGKLSAGVALPQTLPDGTQVGFSVDYRFRTYTPDPRAQYVWEIRKGDGSIERLVVQIAKQKGTLSQFLPVRPEAGPFSSRICAVQGEPGELTPLTDWVSMR